MLTHLSYTYHTLTHTACSETCISTLRWRLMRCLFADTKKVQILRNGGSLSKFKYPISFALSIYYLCRSPAIFICTIDVHKMNFKDTTYQPIEPGYKEREWIHLTWIAPIHDIKMYSYTYVHTACLETHQSTLRWRSIHCCLQTQKEVQTLQSNQTEGMMSRKECPISVNTLLMPDPCRLLGAPNAQLTCVEWIPKTLPPNQSN